MHGQRQEPAAILEHEGWVAAVAFSPDGKTLASAGADKVVRLWEVGAWKAKGVLKGHTDCVCALAFFEGTGGKFGLATGSYDRTARLWDVDKGKEVCGCGGKQPGPVLAVLPHVVPRLTAGVLAGGTDGAFRWLPAYDGLWNEIRRHKSWINGFVAHKSGIATASSDGTVGLVTEIKDEIGKAVFLEGGAGEVRCVAFSPNGKMLAAGNRFGTVRIWDVASKKEIKTITGHMGEVWSIAFSPDGKTLAAVDTEWTKPSKVKLYDTTTWKERGALPCPGEILSIAYSPQGDWLAAGCWDKTVRIFSMAK